MSDSTEVREYVPYRILVKYAKECVKFIRRGTARNVQNFTGIVIDWKELVIKAEANGYETAEGLYLPRGWQAMMQAHATDLMVKESEKTSEKVDG